MKTENKNKWTTFVKPFYDEPIDLEMFGADVRIKKSKIYEDERVRVIHIEEPTFQNEFNNYLELLIKNGAMLMHFPIGGYINMAFAIESVKNVIDALSLSSNDKQEKKPLSEITDEHAIEACKLLFRHPNPEYDITPDEVAVAPFTRGEEYFKLEVVCRCFEGTVMICFNGDIQCFDEEGKLQSINPLTYYQYLQFKGYKLPVYYPEKKGGLNG